MLIAALLTGVLSFFNYMWQVNYELAAALRIISIAAQAVLTAVTLVAAVRYRGKRLRMSYDGAGYKVFTFPFALIVLSVIGNVAVLAVLLLKTAGVITAL